MCASTCEDGNGNKTADEADVEDDGDEGEEGNAAETQGEDDSEDGVEDSGSGHALNGADPCGNWELVIFEHDEEVGEDCEDED